MTTVIVYQLYGGPYDGDFVGFQTARSELDVALPAIPLADLLRGLGPIHVKTMTQMQGAVIQPRYGTRRIGRYQARPKQPLILEWQGEIEMKGEEDGA